MRSWFKLLLIICLGLFLSLGWSKISNARTIPSQLVQKAQKSYQTGKFQHSLQLLQQAYEVYRRQEQYLQQAQVLTLTSLAQQQLGKWDEAKQSLLNSQAVIKEIPKSDRKTQILAQIANAQGHFEYARGNNRGALDRWQAAEQLYGAVNDTLGVTGAVVDRAQALEKMGFHRRSCNLLLNIFDRSNLDCQNLTEPELTKMILRQTKVNPELKQKVFSSIVNSLLSMGKLELAQAAIKTVETNYESFSSVERIEFLFNRGNVRKAIALRDRDRNDIKSFVAGSHQAIADYQTIAQQKETVRYRLPAQLNHLSLLTATEQWSKAQKLVEQIDLTSESNYPANLFTQVQLAHSLELLKQQNITLKYSWQDIAELYLQAIAQAQQNNQQRLQSYALGYLGQLTLEQKIKLDASPQELIERALILARRINAPEIAYRWQWYLGKIYHQQQNRPRAIAFYEAALASLRELRTDIASLTQEVQFSFTEQIEPVYREFADLLLEREDVSKNEIEKALNVIESLQVAELDNYFQDACTTFEPRSIDKIDSQAAVIYTAIFPERLEVILATKNLSPEEGENISSGKIYRHTQKISSAEIAETVQKLREYLTEPDRTTQIQELSSQLYQWLVEPFEAELFEAQPQTLVFVLDNILQNIPMSVLYDGKKYLLEKYAIAITPGLRLLNPDLVPQERSFLAGGVSKSVRVGEQTFSALSNIENELDVFAQSDSKVLLNTNFTPQNLLRQLDLTSASTVHIATHGQFSSNPRKTFLLLWQQLLGVQDFSNLLFSRQKAISEPINLLVLSACDTATGDRRAALGLAGIAVRSGASTTIATLWQVQDDSTARLMENFYQQIAQNKNKAEALRQAQLKLWQVKDKDWRVPAFWSPYILVGNWQ